MHRYGQHDGHQPGHGQRIVFSGRACVVVSVKGLFGGQSRPSICPMGDRVSKGTLNEFKFNMTVVYAAVLEYVVNLAFRAYR